NGPPRAPNYRRLTAPLPNNIKIKPDTPQIIPPRMYQVVACVKRPVKVRLTWSTTECDAFIPVMSNTIPTASRTTPIRRCAFMFDPLKRVAQIRSHRRSLGAAEDHERVHPICPP